MIFTELESEVRGLERYEKFRLLHILVSELEKEEASDVLKNGEEYPIWSPYNANEAAEVLRNELKNHGYEC